MASQPNPSADKFGYWLRSLRKASGKTQREVAASAGIDFTYLSKLEHSKDPAPSEELIVRLARVLEVPSDQLLAAAGKVPASVRKRIDQSPRFALLLRRLAEADNASLDKHYRLAHIREFDLAAHAMDDAQPQRAGSTIRRRSNRG